MQTTLWQTHTQPIKYTHATPMLSNNNGEGEEASNNDDEGDLQIGGAATRGRTAVRPLGAGQRAAFSRGCRAEAG
jgi:hypothetical protein